MGKAWLGLLALCTYGIAFSAVVTTPVGVLNNPGATLASDPFAPDTWMRRNVRFDGSVGITGNYPRSGNGSVWLSLGANTGAGGKADWEYVPSLTFGLLGQLGTVSYEWYRHGASTVPAHLHPVLRLMVDADGNLGTTTDVGYLIFERCYNVPGCPAVPVNTWTTENITGTTILWWFQIGVGVEPVFTRTLATYQAGAYTPTPGFAQLSGSSLVFGISLGVGSGWAGSPPSFLGAVDNVRVSSATPGVAAIDHNFELAADMAASLGLLPGFVSPGQLLTGLGFSCTNLGPGAAPNPTCAIAANVGTISNLSCTPALPVSLLPVGATISCTFDYQAPGTPGGSDTPAVVVQWTATTGSMDDEQPGNNASVASAGLVDAVDDSVSLPAWTMGASFALGANDDVPGGSSFSLLSTSCGGVTVNALSGVATFNVPGSGTCTVQYRLCAPPPWASTCDTAVLTVTAQAVEAIPVTGSVGLGVLALLLAGGGLLALRNLRW